MGSAMFLYLKLKKDLLKMQQWMLHLNPQNIPFVLFYVQIWIRHVQMYQHHTKGLHKFWKLVFILYFIKFLIY